MDLEDPSCSMWAAVMMRQMRSPHVSTGHESPGEAATPAGANFRRLPAVEGVAAGGS